MTTPRADHTALWLLVREQVGTTPEAVQDQQRLQSVLAKRRTRSQEFFSSAAGQWDRFRDDLFGDRFHLAALAALADPRWVVGDLGCGTGHVSAALAPFVARVVAVDASPRDAAGGARRASARPTMSISAAAISRRCRSTMRGSMSPR